MLKISNFSTEAKYINELQVFKNINKSNIFRVATQPTIFPCADEISYILKNTNLNDRYTCNTRKYPIASFRPENLSKCYHIEEGIKRLDSKLLEKFEYTPKGLFLKLYMEDKKFKHRTKSGYPTSSLRRPYQY